MNDELTKLFGNPEALAKALQEFMAAKMAAPRPTFRDLWAKYEEYGTSRTDGGRTKIKSWASQQKSAAAKLLKFFGDLPWDECTLAKMEEYRLWRAGTPCAKAHQRTPGETKYIKAASRNREAQCAAACLSFAVRRGLIPRNPLAGMRSEPTHHDRDFAIPKEDVQAILARCPSWLRQFLTVLYGTGMRRGECLKLEWKEIDLDAGMIHLPAHKTKAGKKRDVTLSSNIRLVFEMLPRDGASPWVWPCPRRAGQHLHENTLSRYWRKARDAAGVKGPDGQEVWLHSLRHTFATDMIITGMPIELVMHMCGWSGPTMAARYINFAKRHLEATRQHLDRRDRDILGPGLRPKRALVTAEGDDVADVG
jgi:integrase